MSYLSLWKCGILKDFLVNYELASSYLPTTYFNFKFKLNKIKRKQILNSKCIAASNFARNTNCYHVFGDIAICLPNILWYLKKKQHRRRTLANTNKTRQLHTYNKTRQTQTNTLSHVRVCCFIFAVCHCSQNKAYNVGFNMICRPRNYPNFL